MSPKRQRGGNEPGESSIWGLSTRGPSLLQSMSTVAGATAKQKSVHVAVEKLFIDLMSEISSLWGMGGSHGVGMRPPALR